MNWSISCGDGSKEEKDGTVGTKMVTVLRYKNKEVMRKAGQMGRDSLKTLCEKYNAENYDPKLGPSCIADLPPSEREEAIRKLPNDTPGFPGLMLSPEENRKARKLYTGDKSE